MSMPLSHLVQTVGRVRGTSKKLEKVALIAELLRETQEREAELVALYLSGTLPQGRIGIGYRTIQGGATESPRSGEPLTLLDVDQAFETIADASGPGSAERKAGALRALMERADAEERR